MPKKDTKLQKLSEEILIIIEEIRGLGIEDLVLLSLRSWQAMMSGLRLPILHWMKKKL